MSGSPLHTHTYIHYRHFDASIISRRQYVRLFFNVLGVDSMNSRPTVEHRRLYVFDLESLF